MSSIRTEPLEGNFYQGIHRIGNILASKDSLLSMNFQPVKTSSARWVFLKLVSPFYTLVGKDAFAHVRIQNIVKNLASYIQLNRHFMNTYSCREIQNKIIVPLNKLTSNKYNEYLTKMMSGYTHLIHDRVYAPQILISETGLGFKPVVETKRINIDEVLKEYQRQRDVFIDSFKKRIQESLERQKYMDDLRRQFEEKYEARRKVREDMFNKARQHWEKAFPQRQSERPAQERAHGGYAFPQYRRPPQQPQFNLPPEEKIEDVSTQVKTFFGVDDISTPELLKKAYKKWAVKNHPDKCLDKVKAEIRFKEGQQLLAKYKSMKRWD